MASPLVEVIALDGTNEVGRWILEPGAFTVGRSASCSIALPQEGLSREHGRLLLDEAGCLHFEDLGSVNGSLVDAEPVPSGATVALLPNQTVSLGGLVDLLIRRPADPEVTELDLPADLPQEQEATNDFADLDRYKVGAQIARGGMGAVLAARQIAARRTVAMKVILQRAEEDPRSRVRFLEEAQITSQLEHPNIVPVHDVGVDRQGRLFYTMKLVQGITLKKVLELLKQGKEETARKYPLATLLTVYQKVCDAVAFAHSKKVIHRDLKPENIMIGSYGEVLVMDWGLAKLVEHAAAAAHGAEASAAVHVNGATIESVRVEEGDEYATLDGSVIGTPAYMAPEQARGAVDALDQRTDIFSLGTILYEILTLERPFLAASARGILDRVLTGQPPIAPVRLKSRREGKSGAAQQQRPPAAAVPSSLSAVAMRALAFRPEDRYQRVTELQADLTAYQNGFATSAEQASAWTHLRLLVKRNKAATLGLGAVLLVGGFLGARVVAEGHRAERALVDLRRQAPGLRQLSESEAVFQNFESSLDKLDAALALDPGHLPSYWRRAWLFIGMGRLNESIRALQVARDKDPAHAEFAAILPALEELAALPAGAPWPATRGREVFDHLDRMGAAGEKLALTKRLKLGSAERLALVRQRIEMWLGRGKGGAEIENGGVLTVALARLPIQDLAPLRGLPIDALELNATQITSLEPLRGMTLVRLNIAQTRVIDLGPLTGMKLRDLNLDYSEVADLHPINGMPLEILSAKELKNVNYAQMHWPRLRIFRGRGLQLSALSFLAASPLEQLETYASRVTDLGPLRGKPLKIVNLSFSPISDLSPLRGSPIEDLTMLAIPAHDFTPLLQMPKLKRLMVAGMSTSLEPLRKHPTLQFLAAGDKPYQPAAEFWAEYDRTYGKR